MQAYIISMGLISPQRTFENDFSCGVETKGMSILPAVEPNYRDLINPVQLRRISRILKLGLGAAQLCINNAGGQRPDAIVVGTGLACVNDIETFVKSIIETGEQHISPIPFINSLHNTVAAQIARTLKVQTYNNTHCHRGASFENALLDALMLLNEKESRYVLAGGIDEFSIHYHTLSAKSAVAGEGAGFFLLCDRPPAAETGVKITAVGTFYRPAADFIARFLAAQRLEAHHLDAAVLGINGDPNDDAIYHRLADDFFTPGTQIISYKHLCGEYHTSGAFALALAARALIAGAFPAPAVWRPGKTGKPHRILLYNHYQNCNHALILVETRRAASLQGERVKR
ncbi:MAG: beta-ketoacyl synthase chain length factor [Prevotellaceae bacterium]|jgi:3-oxoacyl-(acyl-carrier-protein) synthase|nr:beta-ketoacyl synthase chain length factor [Prevotellaceae bacterium]